jgi:hypothetical protein
MLGSVAQPYAVGTTMGRYLGKRTVGVFSLGKVSSELFIQTILANIIVILVPAIWSPRSPGDCCGVPGR